MSVALVSINIGALNWWQAHDPNYTLDGSAKLSQDAAPSLKEVWRESKDVMCIHTFLLIIIQVLLLLMSFVLCQGLTWLYLMSLRPTSLSQVYPEIGSVSQCITLSCYELMLEAILVCIYI